MPAVEQPSPAGPDGGAGRLVGLRRQLVAGRIEQEAIRLFAERGYESVTVPDIAGAVGMSARTFFRYYRSKGELLRAHQRRLDDRLLRALAARPPEEGPATALQAAFLATSRMRAEDRDRIVAVGRIIVAAQPDPLEVAGYSPSCVQQLAGEVARRSGASPGALGVVVLCSVTYAAAQAAFRVWLSDDDERELETLLHDAFTFLGVPLPDDLDTLCQSS